MTRCLDNQTYALWRLSRKAEMLARDFCYDSDDPSEGKIQYMPLEAAYQAIRKLRDRGFAERIGTSERWQITSRGLELLKSLDLLPDTKHLLENLSHVQKPKG